MDTAPKSKKPTTPPGFDPTAAWVSVVDLRNIFTEQMRRLDVEVCPVGRSPTRYELLAFFESLLYRCYQRAVANFDDFLARNPVKAEAIIARREAIAATAAAAPPELATPDQAAADSRSDYDKRRELLAQRNR